MYRRMYYSGGTWHKPQNSHAALLDKYWTKLQMGNMTREELKKVPKENTWCYYLFLTIFPRSFLGLEKLWSLLTGTQFSSGLLVCCIDLNKCLPCCSPFSCVTGCVISELGGF